MKNQIISLGQNTHLDNTPAIKTSTADASNAGDEGVGVAGGAYTAQTFSSRYQIEVTTAGAYGVGEVTITNLFSGGTDTDISTTFKPVDGVAFAVGTVGITFTLSDGGDAVLTLGDKWYISAMGTITLVNSKMQFVKTDPAGKQVEKTLYPKRLQLKNSSGAILDFNIISEGEYEDFITDQTAYDFIPVSSASTFTMTDLHPMLTCSYVAVKTTAAPSGDVSLELINYQPMR